MKSETTSTCEAPASEQPERRENDFPGPPWYDMVKGMVIYENRRKDNRDSRHSKTADASLSCSR